MKKGNYIPALAYDFLTPYYDLLFKALFPETDFKNALIERADIINKANILDIGCGTGTLSIMIKRKFPDAIVNGIDGDERILRIANKKAKRRGVTINFIQGMSFQLPDENRAFNQVFCTMMFHHLTTENKLRTLKEIYRVLKPKGEFLFADFGEPHNIYSKLVTSICFRNNESAANVKGHIPSMIKNADFIEVEEIKKYTTLFGTLSLYKAEKGTATNNTYKP